jgi:hypothetical protein
MKRVAGLAAGLVVALGLSHEAVADRGRFVVKPPLLESAAMRETAREMSATGVLEELASAFNALFVLPTDIAIRYAECGEVNAYYDGENRQILMCLELVEGMTEVLAGQFDDEDELSDAIAGAFIAVALHEVGHALVDVLELPITGREEDAVDQLAAWILIEADDVDSVLGAAASYYVEDEEVADEDLAGEHSLNRQRYYNMVCWAYGSDPENSQELIDSWELPEDRASGCEAEYDLLDRSWTRLLKPHLREEGGESSERRPPPRVQGAPPGAEQATAAEGSSGSGVTTAIGGLAQPRPETRRPGPTGEYQPPAGKVTVRSGEQRGDD